MPVVPVWERSTSVIEVIHIYILTSQHLRDWSRRYQISLEVISDDLKTKQSSVNVEDEPVGWFFCYSIHDEVADLTATRYRGFGRISRFC